MITSRLYDYINYEILKKKHKKLKPIEFRVKRYRIDTSTKKWKEEYRSLSVKLLKRWFVCFSHHTSYDKAQEFKKKTLWIHKMCEEHIFSNQINTIGKNWNLGLRLFLWSEYIYPNANIKEWYYIDTGYTKVLEKINNTCKCQYCWKCYPIKEEWTVCCNTEYKKIAL